MAKIRQFFLDMPLRKAFAASIASALAGIVLLSGFTIWGCSAVRNWLLPETEQAVLSLNAEYADGEQYESITLTLMQGEKIPLLHLSEADEQFVSYTFDKIERSYKVLSPKRELLYLAASAAMVVMPIVYCIAAVFLCAVWFYKQKLKVPLQILEEAADQIARQDLDFTIQYNSKDEFGKLCTSFEVMRTALVQTNRKMWDILEEQKNLQASIAHDLRNPIAIIKGYAEYLQINLPKGSLTPEQAAMITDNLAASADRLKRYTDSVRNISQLEALQVHPCSCALGHFLAAASEDMKMLAGSSNISLNISDIFPDRTVLLDTESYSRVLENLLQNALRFAKTEIHLFWKLDGNILTTLVSDDGPGFPEYVLQSRKHKIFSADSEHMGMGLVVSQILCRKHGGDLKLENGKSGAIAEFSLRV